MSQLSLTQSFDTSLLDITVARPSQETTIDSSSSTTASQPNSFSSDTAHQPRAPFAASMANQTKPAKEITHLPTTTAYDRWAPTYDTDGNMLVSLDTIQLTSGMLSRFLHALAESSPAARPTPEPSPHNRVPEPALHIVDLGGGTGRATLLLIAALQDPKNAAAVARLVWPSSPPPPSPSPSAEFRPSLSPRPIHITSLDSSAGMQAIARDRVPASLDIPIPSLPGYHHHHHHHPTAPPTTTVRVTVRFALYDLLAAAPPAELGPVHAVMSTLVLEHVPLGVFFERVAALLGTAHDGAGSEAGSGTGRSGKAGVALVTNMHPDMGNRGSSSTSNRSNNSSRADPGQPATAAGFTDAATGVKIRGTSYAHSAGEVVEAARGVGMRGVLEEMAVTEEMIASGQVGERGAKWVGWKCWLGGVFVAAGAGGKNGGGR